MRNLIYISIFLTLLIGISSICQAKDWQTMKNKHFIAYYRNEVPESFVDTVLDSAEDDYRSVVETLGISYYQSWSFEKPVSIYIYRDEEDYVKKGGQAGWSHGTALIATKTINTYPSDQGFFDSLLPHELGHIVLHEFIGTEARVPLWMEEGVAMFQEKAKRIGANKIVRDALANGQFIALTQLTDMRLYSNSDRQTVELFYAESASIVNFMITELGKGRFFRLCEQIKESKPFLDALSDVYPNIQTLDALNKKWVNYLKDNS